MANEATKFDDGKLRYDLIPPGPLRELAWVYTMGAKKYGDNNWQGGLARERIVAAMMRHTEKYRSGELRDQDDGQLHLSSVAWCAFALMWYDMKSDALVAQVDHEKHIKARKDFLKRVPGQVCATPNCKDTSVGGLYCNKCQWAQAEDGRKSFT